jgi:hypothetical protein
MKKKPFRKRAAKKSENEKSCGLYTAFYSQLPVFFIGRFPRGGNAIFGKKIVGFI